MKEKEESSSSIVIKDPLIEPYFITRDQYCYTINEVTTPDPKYTSSGKTYIRSLGHYSKFNICLEEIALQKLNKKNYSSIKEYIAEWKKITESFKNLIEI